MKSHEFQNHPIARLLRSRVAYLDGAMGTMIQGYKLGEADFRGERFKDHPKDLKGNNDLLVLTRPDVIEAIHREYLEAGADMIETNTFSSTTIAQADYALEPIARELNREAARLARRAADAVGTPEHPRFVAGAVGPTNRTLSLSPDVNNPAYRAATFEELAVAYQEQVEGLIEGGVDAILIETIFDTLNAKAAIYGMEEAFAAAGKRLPIMISVTIVDLSGRTLSGQTLEAFWISIRHCRPLTVGLNCALGADQMRPHVEEIAQIADCFTCIYPNAGLPNPLAPTGYDETPEHMASQVREWAEAGWINMLGGCCGTTPAFIAAIKAATQDCAPRALPNFETGLSSVKSESANV